MLFWGARNWGIENEVGESGVEFRNSQKLE